MKPLVLPASTSLAAFAGALSILIIEVLKHFGIELSMLAQQALPVVVAVGVGHGVTDSPSGAVAREAVADAAVAADASTANDKAIRQETL